MGDESPMHLYKKNSLWRLFVANILNFHGIVLGKKVKIKGGFIVELKNFYHYLVEIEAEETVAKKIK